MISEAQSEQASLYVMGLLAPDDARAFELELAENPELSAEVASLNNATLALAHSAPKVIPPPVLRERVLATVAQPANNIIPLPQARRFRMLPWAVAACLAGICAWQLKHQIESTELLNTQAQQMSATQAKLVDLQTISAAQAQELTGKLASAETARSQWEAKFTEAAQKLAMAETDRQAMVARLTALEQKDILTQAKIAVLGSLIKDRPQAVAVSVWDQQKQQGVLVVENMPVLAKGRDYQLWIIDPGIQAPVSAGVFQVDAEGKWRVNFKPNQAINNAGKFAVTEEIAGGVASPTMKNMVVIGG